VKGIVDDAVREERSSRSRPASASRVDAAKDDRRHGARHDEEKARFERVMFGCLTGLATEAACRRYGARALDGG